MYLFFAIIFIAELIIASTLILLIVKADIRVCELISAQDKCRSDVIKCLDGFKSLVNNFVTYIDTGFDYLKKKREQFLIKISKTIIVYLALYIIGKKFKKAGPVFHTIVLVKDFWNEVYNS